MSSDNTVLDHVMGRHRLDDPSRFPDRRIHLPPLTIAGIHFRGESRTQIKLPGQGGRAHKNYGVDVAPDLTQFFPSERYATNLERSQSAAFAPTLLTFSIN